eukprot:191163_1
MIHRKSNGYPYIKYRRPPLMIECMNNDKSAHDLSLLSLCFVLRCTSCVFGQLFNKRATKARVECNDIVSHQRVVPKMTYESIMKCDVGEKQKALADIEEEEDDVIESDEDCIFPIIFPCTRRIW